MSVKIDGSGIITGLDADGISAQPVFPGNVLQVVQEVTNAQTTTTSASFVSGGLSASITPSSASSKILVLCSFTGSISSRAQLGVFTIFRDSVGGVNLSGGTTNGLISIYPSSNDNILTGVQLTFLDSPSSANQVSYFLAMKNSSGTNATTAVAGDPAKTIMTLMEIAA
jgi:hypothetical protein